MYDTLKVNKCEPICKIKWINIIKEHVNENDWGTIFASPFQTTIDTSLQWFQYRIIHRTIATNYFLNKIQYTDNPNCTFCNINTETIEHLFWECTYVQQLLNTLFKDKCNLYYVNKVNFILGILDNALETYKAHNTLFLFIKRYIYNSRVRKIKPNIKGLTFYIKWQYNVLLQNSITHNSLINFTQDWKDILLLFE